MSISHIKASYHAILNCLSTSSDQTLIRSALEKIDASDGFQEEMIQSSQQQDLLKKLQEFISDANQFKTVTLKINTLFSNTSEGLIQRMQLKPLEASPFMNELLITQKATELYSSPSEEEKKNIKQGIDDFQRLPFAQQVRFLSKLKDCDGSFALSFLSALLHLKPEELIQGEKDKILGLAKKIFSEIININEIDQKNRKNSQEGCAKVMTRVYFLEELRNWAAGPISNPIEEREKIAKEIQAEILRTNRLAGILHFSSDDFDSDGDGACDSEDSFPMNARYSMQDRDQDGIPEELKERGFDPKKFYGLKDGEIRSYRHLDFMRVKDDLYLIINTYLVPAHEFLFDKAPILQDKWKKEIEKSYQAMMPPAVDPIKVLVNFDTLEGHRVVMEESKHSKMIFADKAKTKEIAIPGVETNNGTFPYDIDIETLSHEMGHLLGYSDRYRAEHTQSFRLSIFRPLIESYWQSRTHLMNQNTLRIDPVDIVFTVDMVLSLGKPAPLKQSFSMGIAEAYFLKKDYLSAAEIYSQTSQAYQEKAKSIVSRDSWISYVAKKVSLRARIYQNLSYLKWLEAEGDEASDWNALQTKPSRERWLARVEEDLKMIEKEIDSTQEHVWNKSEPLHSEARYPIPEFLYLKNDLVLVETLLEESKTKNLK